MNTRRMLVTGVTGCVGRAVAAVASQRGWRVHGLARAVPPNQQGGWPAEVVQFLGDVRDRTVVERAAAGCIAVVHLAGWVHRYPTNDNDLTQLEASIVDGTRNVANVAAALAARLVFTSSVAVFGRGTSDDVPPRPTTPYGRAKLEAERVARSICPDALILRPALVYGPYDRGNVAQLIRLVDRGFGIVIGDGANRKSVVHASNLGDRIVAGVERLELRGSWVVADDPALTQAELIADIARALHRRRPLSLPGKPVVAVARAIDRLVGGHWSARIASMVQSTEFSGFALDQALGYAPRVSWREGIRTQVERWTSA